MSTGDIRNNFENLRRLLVKIKYFDYFNRENLLNGDVDEYIPILKYIFIESSRVVAKYINDLDYKLYGTINNDKFIEKIWKICRNVFNYYPKLTSYQFLSLGFAERKLITICDIIKLSMNLHNKLCKTLKANKLKKKGPKLTESIIERLAPPMLNNSNNKVNNDQIEPAIIKYKKKDSINLPKPNNKPPKPSPKPIKQNVLLKKSIENDLYHALNKVNEGNDNDEGLSFIKQDDDDDSSDDNQVEEEQQDQKGQQQQQQQQEEEDDDDVIEFTINPLLSKRQSIILPSNYDFDNNAINLTSDHDNNDQIDIDSAIDQIMNRLDTFELNIKKNLDTLSARMTLLEGKVRFLEVQRQEEIKKNKKEKVSDDEDDDLMYVKERVHTNDIDNITITMNKIDVKEEEEEQQSQQGIGQEEIVDNDDDDIDQNDLMPDTEYFIQSLKNRLVETEELLHNTRKGTINTINQEKDDDENINQQQQEVLDKEYMKTAYEKDKNIVIDDFNYDDNTIFLI